MSFAISNLSTPTIAFPLPGKACKKLRKETPQFTATGSALVSPLSGLLPLLSKRTPAFGGIQSAHRLHAQ
jgi:hypothetical protein